jgi:selenide,water dikinase
VAGLDGRAGVQAQGVLEHRDHAHCIRAGDIPGGLKNNRDFAECTVGYDEAISEESKAILFDPQTAGGLLIAVAAEHSPNLLRDLKAAGIPAVEIGEVLKRTRPLIAIAA